MSRTIIIAEAGVNHNGDINLAKQLIDKAGAAGVDYVKFQMFKADKVVSKNANKADYQKQTTGNNESQLDMVKQLELSESDYSELQLYASQNKVNIFSTAFDLDSIDTVNKYKPEVIKIPSGEITNLPYLEKLCNIDYKPWIYLSTGMCTLSEIETAIGVLRSNGQNKITVLHCNTEYPTPMVDVNLRAMQTIGTAFDVEVGYSDHTLGIEVPIAAVALGARVIEKHFTLDRNMEGPDHRASLEPDELKQMVSSIRNIERALGSTIKQPSKSELKNKDIARKSIVANHNIKKGDILTVSNLTVKRPGTGISPMLWYDIIGTVATKDYNEDDLI